MRLISFEEADPQLSWRGVSDALWHGHTLAKAKIGDLLLQDAPNALLSRGAWIPGLGMALKSMSVFPENVLLPDPQPSIQGGVLLFAPATGALSCVIDGILVTKWKTAGDSVLGAKLLANPFPRTHLMIGAGTVAASIISAYHEIFSTIDRFVIWNRSAENAHMLANKMAERVPGIDVCTDLPTACSKADVITSATMTNDPIIHGDWIKPGSHVDLIGAFKPDMREADDTLLSKASLFVDSRETTIGHIGEIDIPLKAGTIGLNDIKGDLYEIVSGQSGRQSGSEITVFKNGGGAHLDLMTSLYISKKCI